MTEREQRWGRRAWDAVATVKSLLVVSYIALSVGCRSLPSGDGSALFWFVDQEGMGFMNYRGETVIYPRFEYAYGFSDGLALVRIGGKMGYIDRTGKQVIEPRFSYGMASSFHEGLASVTIHSNAGYIDKAGNFAINLRFDRASRFKDGLATVVVNGKYGFINREGEMVVDAQFDDAEGFSEGLAYVKTAGKYGYIDRHGRFAIRPRFHIVHSAFGRAWLWSWREGTMVSSIIKATW